MSLSSSTLPSTYSAVDSESSTLLSSQASSPSSQETNTPSSRVHHRKGEFAIAVTASSIPLILLLTLFVIVPYSPSMYDLGSSSTNLPPPKTTIYTTAKSSLSTPWAESSSSSPFSPSVPLPSNHNHATLTFSRENLHQSILGFGGAFTESASLNFASLPPSGQSALLEALFGSTGLGYTLGRTHMNSCDFSVASYDFDSLEGDFELSSFDESVKHDARSMIPFMSRATAHLKSSAFNDDLKIVASPWSPPAWMKENGSMLGSEPGYCLKSDPAYAEAWAKYFAKFLEAYKGEGARARVCVRGGRGGSKTRRCRVRSSRSLAPLPPPTPRPRLTRSLVAPSQPTASTCTA